MKAWVVFDDNAELPTLRWMLRPGYRHCWVLVRDDAGRWITIDPMSDHLEITVQDQDMGFDYPGWLREQGYTAVIEAPVSRALDKAFPLKWVSCVETCKHFLGIRGFWIWSPWDLYCHLTGELTNEII